MSFSLAVCLWGEFFGAREDKCTSKNVIFTCGFCVGSVFWSRKRRVHLEECHFHFYVKLVSLFMAKLILWPPRLPFQIPPGSLQKMSCQKLAPNSPQMRSSGLGRPWGQRVWGQFDPTPFHIIIITWWGVFLGRVFWSRY